MMILSQLCGIMIFVYSVCRLSSRVFNYKNLGAVLDN